MNENITKNTFAHSENSGYSRRIFLRQRDMRLDTKSYLLLFIFFKENAHIWHV